MRDDRLIVRLVTPKRALTSGQVNVSIQPLERVYYQSLIIILIVLIVHKMYFFQYAVFYDGEECLGGARIIQPGPSLYSLNEELIFHQNLNH